MDVPGFGSAGTPVRSAAVRSLTFHWSATGEPAAQQRVAAKGDRTDGQSKTEELALLCAFGSGSP